MKLKEWIKKKRWENYLKEIDREWLCSGASSWELFPPSVYLLHTPEEIEVMREQRLKEVREAIDRIED